MADIEGRYTITMNNPRRRIDILFANETFFFLVLASSV